MNTRTISKWPVHPAVRAQRRVLGLLLACFLLLSLSLLVTGIGAVACLPLFAACAFGWLIYRLPRQGRAVQLYNAALQLMLRGRDDEAEALLDQIPAEELRRGAIGVGVHVQRAAIAFHRGDAAQALALSSAALSLPRTRVPGFGWHEEIHRVKAVSLRALSHASLGHEREAEADSAMAETSPAATPDVLGRASLARSVVLARKNDRPALAAHLNQTAGLMLEWLTPRERSLVRAFRLMARAPTKSVYRESARVDQAREGQLASWIEKLAPGAEAYARDTNKTVSLEPLEPLEPADAGPASAVSNVRRAHRSAGTPTRRRVLGLWVAFVVSFLCIWQVLTPGPSRPRHAHVPPSTSPEVPVGFVVLFLGVAIAIVTYRVWLQRRQAKQLAAMQLAVARGEIGKARPSLESLSAATSYSIAAAAHLSLARLAERDARWGDALEHCDRGIARLLRFSAAKATHGDYLLPELMATRAYVLAAADRRDEANAEMTVVTSEYPSYVWIAVAEFRTRLMAAVRAGDLSAAARVAMTRTADLPLSIRDDTLSDIVLAGATEVALDERQRIDAELSDDPKLRAWIDAVGPDLRPQMRVRVSPAGKPVADVGELAEDDEVVQDAGNRPRRLVVS